MICFFRKLKCLGRLYSENFQKYFQYSTQNILFCLVFIFNLYFSACCLCRSQRIVCAVLVPEKNKKKTKDILALKDLFKQEREEKSDKFFSPEI